MTLEPSIVQVPMEADYMPSLFSTLSIAAYDRYIQYGNSEVIDDAAALAGYGLHVGDINGPSFPNQLNNHAIILQNRYQHTQELIHLDKAVNLAKQAVTLASNLHSNRALFLNTLANLLECRYRRTGHVADIEEAMLRARQTVEATAADHHNRASRLSNLATKLYCWYDLTEDLEYLDEAAKITSEAARSLENNHRDKAAIMANLGILLRTKYERTKIMEDLHAAVLAWNDAIRHDYDGNYHAPNRLLELKRQVDKRYG